MLDLLNCYLHGFVAIPVILACKKRGLFDLLASKNTASSQQIAHVLQANEGHLGVVLRILESLRWVKRHDDLSYSLTDYSQTVQEIPADIFELLHFPFNEYVTQTTKSQSLTKWIDRSLNHWQISAPTIAKFLDGLLVIPLLLALHKTRVIVDGHLYFHQLSRAAQQELKPLFIGKGWAKANKNSIELTDLGQFLLKRVLLFGVTASYTPMLVQILTWQLLSMHQQMLKTPYLLDKSAFRLHSLLLPG